MAPAGRQVNQQGADVGEKFPHSQTANTTSEDELLSEANSSSEEDMEIGKEIATSQAGAIDSVEDGKGGECGSTSDVKMTDTEDEGESESESGEDDNNIEAAATGSDVSDVDHDYDSDESEESIDEDDLDLESDEGWLARLPVGLHVGKGGDIPNHLWRTFSPASGGGSDPRLNNKDGIVPLGFLKHLDKPIRPISEMNLRRLQTIVQAHMESGQVESKFSSWSQLVYTAFHWGVTAAKDHNTMTLALLDTTQTEMHVEIFATTDLNGYGYCSNYFPEEFLVYGPIKGPAYVTAPLPELEKRGFFYLLKPSSSWDPSRHIPWVERSTSLTSADVAVAKNVAGTFDLKGLRGKEMFVAVVVDFTTERLSNIEQCPVSKAGEDRMPPVYNKWLGEIMDLLASALEEELDTLSSAVAQGHNLRLVNHKTCIRGDGIERMTVLVELLIRMEELIRKKAQAISQLGQGEDKI